MYLRTTYGIKLHGTEQQSKNTINQYHEKQNRYDIGFLEALACRL
jgi:hypothetical protein